MEIIGYTLLGMGVVIALGGPTLWISKEEPLSFLVDVLSVCLFLVILAVLLFRYWYEFPTYFGLVFAVIFVVIAIGLLRLSLWAFWAANLMMLILFASLTGISIIFYYEYIYYDMSRITILAIFIPAISGIFWCLLVFEKHKLRFR